MKYGVGISRASIGSTVNLDKIGRCPGQKFYLYGGSRPGLAKRSDKRMR